MSVQSAQNKIRAIQNDIESLQRRLTEKSKQEASKSGEIARVKRSITGNTSASSLKSKSRQIERLENDIVHLQRDKAELTQKIARKTADLHGAQQDLYKTQDREQNNFLKSIENQHRSDRRSQEGLLHRLGPPHNPAAIVNRPVLVDAPRYDAFISHAHEDKDDLVRPLADALVHAGVSVWYDEFELKVGDSLRQSIDRGLAGSRFGIVVLSPAFFAKNWPQYELDGLVAKEIVAGKVILPLWHKVSKNEVIQYSPTLADRVALNTTMHTIQEIAGKLAEAIGDHSR